MKRKPFVCANWKLHQLYAETLSYLEELKKEKDLDEADLAVAPVTTLLFAACKSVHNSRIQIAAQNVFHEKYGAFTGEWSVEHIRELGCSYAIVGHSERRQYFAETDESVAKKVNACFEVGVVPIACVGESFQQRENGEIEAVLIRQVESIISQVSASDATRLIIAYEPIWAIGTGLTATPEAAQQAHAIIRNIVATRFSEVVSEQVRIIYGGSVKPDNAKRLASEPDIDGALVGGASLQAESFAAIVRAVLMAQKR